MAVERGGLGCADSTDDQPRVQLQRRAVARFPILRLAGTPYEIGLAHGRACRDGIRRLLRCYADEAGSTAGKLTCESIAAASNWQPISRPTNSTNCKALPMASGCHWQIWSFTIVQIWADLGSDSWHCAFARADGSEERPLHAVAEKLPLSGFLRECLKPSIQVRQPARGLPHFLLSFVGGVGGLFGANSAGLSLSVCRLKSSQGDAEMQSPGGVASVISMVLTEADSIEAAIALLKARSLRGPFAACITHGSSDRVCYLEWNGRSLAVLDRLETASADNTVHLNDGADGNSLATTGVAETHQLLATCAGPGITLESLKGQCEGGAGTASSDPRLAVIYDPVNGNLWLNNAGLGDHPAREFCRFPLSELMPPSLAGETRVTAVECAGL